MNFYFQTPFYYAYILPQNIVPNTQSYQSLQIQHQRETFLHSQPYTQIHFLNPNQSQIQLKNFIKLIPHIKDKQSNISYMEINQKLTIKQVPNFQSFLQIYNRGLQRYKTSYKQNQRKFSWGTDDLVVFLWILDKYSFYIGVAPKHYTHEDWNYVSRLLPFRTPQDCMFKFLDLRKTPLFKYPWTQAQQQYLKKLVQQLAPNVCWASISQSLYKKFPNNYRTSKQCRQHYSLNKTAESNRAKKWWSIQQDLALMMGFEKQGKKWKRISRLLVGRSQNAIKNRFTLLVSKYYRKEKDVMGEGIIGIIKKRIIQNQNAMIEQRGRFIEKLRMIGKGQGQTDMECDLLKYETEDK